MKRDDFQKVLEEILKEDKRYNRDAYYFVREGLDHTIKMLKRSPKAQARHVSGHELLEGIRHYTLQQYGPLSRAVLEHWGIRRSEDFGEIVFNLVDKGLLSRTEQDSKDDFKGGYDFEEAFEKPFRPSRASRQSARPPSANRPNPSGEKPDRAQGKAQPPEPSKS